MSNSRRRLLSRSEAAEALGLKPQTLAKWAMVGNGPAVIKIGRSVKYEEQDIDDFIEQCKRSSTKL